ncbi:MAG: hypothetical protein HYR96_04445 [Deltaproteobacteria bacterium]|nr:hypothetical protein [Deltaproteobacteria bacterium]MBI3296288.1 hypothetical protein [Deltaproteobacteria bacterium]
MTAVTLNFYGIRVRVEGESALTARIEGEFGYFIADESVAPIFRIRVHPKFERTQNWRKLFRTKWSTLYLSKGKERRVCFFNKAWVAYRFEAGECDVYCDEAPTSFEVVYLVVLSYVGEELDRRGLHRVHGMGLCRDGRGILFLGTSGVGKSTLAIEFLKEHSSRILSDDTPLVEESGGMMAFPQRIALKEMPSLNPQHVKRFKRTEFGEKFVIASSYFRDRVQPSVLTDAVVYLTREGNDSIEIKSLTRAELFVLLLRWLVIGHETPQVWQLYLRFSPLSVWWKSRILVSRLRCAWAISRRSRPWKVNLAEDAERSADQLKTWISNGTLETRVPGEIL